MSSLIYYLCFQTYHQLVDDEEEGLQEMIWDSCTVKPCLYIVQNMWIITPDNSAVRHHDFRDFPFQIENHDGDCKMLYSESNILLLKKEI